MTQCDKLGAVLDVALTEECMKMKAFDMNLKFFRGPLIPHQILQGTPSEVSDTKLMI